MSQGAAEVHLVKRRSIEVEHRDWIIVKARFFSIFTAVPFRTVFYYYPDIGSICKIH